MTHIGMTHAEWRQQFGNPLGLTHDRASNLLMKKHIHYLAEDGMKGLNCGSANAWPVIGPDMAKSRPNRLIGPDGKPKDLIVTVYMKIGGVTQLFGEDPARDEVTMSKRAAMPYLNWHVKPGARSASLSYYYRNREKVRQYQQARRARMKS